MRIIGHMVMRNEADRYLAQSLSWLRRVCPEIYVYDDRSTDRSVAVASLAGAQVWVRRPSAASFRENESRFRQDAWEWMSTAGALSEEDWVLCIDADEFLVQVSSEARTAVEQQALLAAQAQFGRPITFDVAEIFALRNGQLMRRTDGYWASISARRFARWDPRTEFVSKVEGGGSLPAVSMYESALDSTALTILHLGYADADDRQAKHARYSGGAGHNPAHVASIIGRPILKPWDGQIPEVL